MNFILLILLLFFSCADDSKNKEDKEISLEEQLSNSLIKWEEIKPDVYTYRITHSYGGSWEGLKENYGVWSTLIAVENNEVSCRAFIDVGSKGEKLYKEIGKDIGKHAFGAKALTIDDLYAKCSSVLIANSNRKDLIFGFNNDGILSSCFQTLTDDEILKVADGINDSIYIKEIIFNQDRCTDK